MITTITPTAQTAWTALRTLLIFTVLLGLVYPLLIAAAGLLAPAQASGQPLTHEDRVVGSALLAQASPGPEWFQPRPSVAGADGWDGLASGASNLAATSPVLAEVVAERRAVYAAENGVTPASVPADALYASGSGLDPDISPENARAQAARVAEARGLPAADIERLIAAHTHSPWAGFLGSWRVNVLELNRAVAELTED